MGNEMKIKRFFIIMLVLIFFITNVLLLAETTATAPSNFNDQNAGSPENPFMMPEAIVSTLVMMKVMPVR